MIPDNCSGPFSLSKLIFLTATIYFKCYTPNELMSIYEISNVHEITKNQLESILPSLVYLDVQKLCQYKEEHLKYNEMQTNTQAQS